MKSEFNLLKGLLFDSNTYSANGDCNWSEVSALLEKLEDKIDEVEKRIDCAIRSAKEINESITKYTEEVDDELPIKMSVNDHDLIQNCSDDVRIALSLDDDMCVVDNWYNLFQVKEEPIKQEVFMSFESSWGTLTCDKEGYVIEVIGDEEYNGERNYLYDIWQIDLAEYEKFLNSIGQNLDYYHDDILSVGYWNKVDGKEKLLQYNKPDTDWRWTQSMFTPEDDDAPTVLCQTPQTHEFVKDIIAKLKVIDVDGETMEYILEQVGMKEQVLKQLFAQSTNDEIDYLHDVRNGKG
jgi:hypothetical protein